MVPSNQYDQELLNDPRVRFAAERTLLAWMRTGLSLMGFGFVVARFGLFLRELAVSRDGEIRYPTPGWSIWIGTGLIGLGIVVSLLTSIEYYRFTSRVVIGPPYPRTWLLAVVVTLLMVPLGIVLAVYLIITNA